MDIPKIPLLVLIAAATGLQACSTIPADSPQALVGSWRIDLRPTPDADPYYQELIVTRVTGDTFEGTFYGSEITASRINSDWGNVHFVFMTQDSSGAYHSSGVLEGDAIRGTTHATGRGFLSVWTGTRAAGR